MASRIDSTSIGYSQERSGASSMIGAKKLRRLSTNLCSESLGSEKIAGFFVATSCRLRNTKGTMSALLGGRGFLVRRRFFAMRACFSASNFSTRSLCSSLAAMKARTALLRRGHKSSQGNQDVYLVTCSQTSKVTHLLESTMVYIVANVNSPNVTLYDRPFQT